MVQCSAMSLGLLLHAALMLYALCVPVPPATVNIEKQYGVTISSASIVVDKTPSEHFRYIYNPWFRDQTPQSHPEFYNFPFPKQECSLEMLGFTSVSAPSKHQPKNSMWFPLRSDGLGEMPGYYVSEEEEQAHVVIMLDGAPLRFRCYCQQIQHSFNRRGGFYTQEGIVVYFCPIVNKKDCEKLNRRRSSTGAGLVPRLLVNLTTAYRNIDRNGGETRPLLHNSFVMNSIPAIPSPPPLVKSFMRRHVPGTMPIPDMAVCTALTYSSSYDDKQEAIMSSLTAEWLRHYRGLNMRVGLYDLMGVALGNVAREVTGYGSRSLIDYHYSIYDIIGQRPDRAPEGYEAATADNERTTKWRWLVNSDKMATLTHCRFEMRALYNIEKVLVADADEFLYCDPQHYGHAVKINRRIGGGYGTQRAILADVLQQSGIPGTELSFSQDVPYQITDGHIRDCMGNATAAGKSIFTCISSARHVAKSSSKLRKHLHTRILCPYTNYHNACLVHADSPHYNCSCKVNYIDGVNKYKANKKQGDACTIVHYEIKPMNKYKTDLTRPVSELVALSQSPT